MIDFFAMEPARYQQYIHAAHAFIKENGLLHEGVFHNVIEGFPVLFERLAARETLSLQEGEAVLAAYAREDAVFSARYAQIFERCVGDPFLKADMEFWLGGVHTWAKAVTDASEAAFDRICRDTAGLSYALACKAFDEVIRTERETLSQLIDRVYHDSYK